MLLKFLIRFLVVFLVMSLLTLWGYLSLNSKIVIEGTRLQKMRRRLTMLLPRNWVTSGVIGFAAGLVNSIPSLVRSGIFFYILAPILFVTILAIFAHFVTLWFRRGATFWTLIPFVLAIVLIYIIARGTAWYFSAMWAERPFLTSVATILPLMGMTAGLGLILANFFCFWAICPVKWRILAKTLKTIVIIITISALLLETIFGIKWRTLNLSERFGGIIQRISAEKDDTDGTEEEESSAAAEEEETAAEDVVIVDPEDLKNLSLDGLTSEELDNLVLEVYKDIEDYLEEKGACLCFTNLYDEERKASGFSDAFSLPLEGDTPEEQWANLRRHIGTDPFLMVSYTVILLDFQIAGIGEIFGASNNWMFDVKYKTEKYGLTYWMTHTHIHENGYDFGVTEEFKRYAARLITLLDKFFVQSGSFQTARNWCMAPDIENSQRHVMEAPYQYRGNFLVFSYIGKNLVPLLVFGVNELDSRIAIPAEPIKPTPEPESTIPEPTTPEPTTPEPTTPEPTTPEPTTPEPTTPEPTTPEPTTPEPTTPEPTTPEPTTPEPTTPEPTTPEPTTPEPTTPEPTEPTTLRKEPEDVKYEGAGADVDNTGPGEDTNNGVGARESTKDQPENSKNHFDTYEEYKEAIEQEESKKETQKTGNDDNTPSYVPPTSAPSTTTESTTTTPQPALDNDDEGKINEELSTIPPIVTPAEKGEKPFGEEPKGDWGSPAD